MTDESDVLPPSAAPAPTWVLVANVDESIDAGKLAPGAKVYVLSAGPEQITVIGRHRGSRRWITVEFDANRLCHWRVKQVRKPGVAARLADGEIAGDEGRARRLCERLTGGAGTSPGPG